MQIEILKTSTIPGGKSYVRLLSTGTRPTSLGLTTPENRYVRERISRGQNLIELNHYTHMLYLLFLKKEKDYHTYMESVRKSGHQLYRRLSEHGTDEIYIDGRNEKADVVLSLAEGLTLSSYRFVKYITDKEKKQFRLKKIVLASPVIRDKDVERLNILVDAVFLCRDLVNEPVSYLTATRLAEAFTAMGRDAGFSVEVFNKKKIESLRMGGLLAVNQGSIDPPTFTIMEWKPPKPKNNKPYVLLGKGVVYDTGGLSLKPTKESMDSMKSDMAGAAAVAAALYAIARAGLPLHIIGLVPATDNRPSGNAYAPGDVITMYNGSTVEVLNSDAEGRMILADALSYAKQYHPGLLINLATLTGSAQMAIGHFGMVGLSNAPSKVFKKLQDAGSAVNERIVEFPLWNEYMEQLKSEIADIKNVGGREGGAITAGKFLEYFTDYPFIHLDIAGCAYVTKDYSYFGKGATGIGVRLLFEFFNNV